MTSIPSLAAGSPLAAVAGGLGIFIASVAAIVIVLGLPLLGAWLYHAGGSRKSPVPDLKSPWRMAKKPAKKEDPLPVVRA